MTECEHFLEVYRKYETAVRSKGFETSKDYEDSIADMDTSKAGKLRFCRTVRNFLAHEQDSRSFASVSDRMTKFILDVVYELDNGELPVSKKIITVSSLCKDTDTVAVAVAFMLKKNTDAIPVFTRNGEFKGIFTSRMLMELVASSKYTKTLKLSAVSLSTKKSDYIVVDKLCPVKDAFSYYRAGMVVLVSENKSVIGTYIK